MKLPKVFCVKMRPYVPSEVPLLEEETVLNILIILILVTAVSAIGLFTFAAVLSAKIPQFYL